MKTNKWALVSMIFGALIMIEGIINSVSWMYWVGAIFFVSIPLIIISIDEFISKKQEENKK